MASFIPKYRIRWSGLCPNTSLSKRRNPSVLEKLMRERVDRMIVMLTDALDEVQTALLEETDFSEMVKREEKRIFDRVIADAAQKAAEERTRQRIIALFPELSEEDVDALLKRAARRW